ncbi:MULTISPECIES: DpnII family type II restriction endonuclease [unclassified Sinorhizobium]|uniref:DpnII family type II restriction endonuclease n=1 Tax=unclassified Sinorhizobium TaxID=2613772 RepID=UPI0024C291DF|nr:MULTISPECIES: DpnII family type II restriction endonuclease [unclassified Sinorhizobium]MDK1378228.1 DpnII family type II restriction endonuclease [Sinorhizobium sp. 6-70]MDK1480389.1 DpnII family type II restriction endonuclease [Sinorhizobium sp. 6-117]
MQVIEQTIDDVVASLSPLSVDWMDDVAASAIASLSALPKKTEYSRADVGALLNAKFEEGLLCVRLFLALSKDGMETELRNILGSGGIGAKRFASDPQGYLDALESLGLLEAMATTINYQPVWSDILVERLRSGRGSAIQGQRRGRGLEDFAEALVAEVFGEGGYETRCTFTGADGSTAKCDVVVPDRNKPRIVIESKAYGATGSKMTDIIGDLDAIIAAKRHDTPLLFLTDGLTWRARTSDLRKIVQRQNQGKITRIYTTKMREQFLNDLHTLKNEFGL